jgi:serine/threonine protein kinase
MSAQQHAASVPLVFQCTAADYRADLCVQPLSLLDRLWTRAPPSVEEPLALPAAAATPTQPAAPIAGVNGVESQLHALAIACAAAEPVAEELQPLLSSSPLLPQPQCESPPTPPALLGTSAAIVSVVGQLIRKKCRTAFRPPPLQPALRAHTHGRQVSSAHSVTSKTHHCCGAIHDLTLVATCWCGCVLQLVRAAAISSARLQDVSAVAAYSPRVQQPIALIAAAAIPKPEWALERDGVWRRSGESVIFRLTRSPPIVGVDGRSIRRVIAKRYFSSSSKRQEDAILSLLARPKTFSAEEYGLFVRQKIKYAQWPTDKEQKDLHLHADYTHSDSKNALPTRAVAANPILFRPIAKVLQPVAKAIHLMFFEFYSNTMDGCLHSTSAPEAAAATPIIPRDFMRETPRTALFWESNSSNIDCGDIPAMERASCSLLRHLFENLAAHHRVRLLLGDIKPANIFFNNDRPRQPVFGDYGHAAHMSTAEPHPSCSRIHPILPAHDSALLAYTHHMHSACDLPDGSSFQAPLNGGAVPPTVASLQAALSIQQPASAALMGIVRTSIGTPAYQAPETLASKGGTGVYTAGSDAYSLAASLIEILSGYSTCMSPQHTALNGGRILALQRQCNELKMFSAAVRTNGKLLTKNSWLDSGSMAIVPLAVLDSLNSLLLPPCGMSQCTKHGSVQQLLDVLSSLAAHASLVAAEESVPMSVDSSSSSLDAPPQPQSSSAPLAENVSMEACPLQIEQDEEQPAGMVVCLPSDVPLLPTAPDAAPENCATPPFLVRFNDPVVPTTTEGQWSEEWQDFRKLLAKIGHLNVETAKFICKAKQRQVVECTRVAEAPQHQLLTLQEWWNKWNVERSNLSLRNSKDKKATYAFDLELPASMLDDLLRVSPPMRCYGPTGYYTLEQYLPDSTRAAISRRSTRRLRWPGCRVFFSPPVHGMIHTSMHMDGRGGLVSMHLIPPCSNPHMRNRVASINLPEATCTDEMQRFALSMDETGGSTADFTKWRYSRTAAVDARMNILPDTNGRTRKLELDDTLNHLLQSPLLKLHLLPDGDAQKGKRMDTIVQPPGAAHRYEKERIQGAANEPGYSLPVGYVNPNDEFEAPLIGVQCASTLLGHDVESTRDNLRVMLKRIQQFRERNIRLKAKDAMIDMQIDLPFFFGLFVTDLWKRPTPEGQSDIHLQRLQQQHRIALRPFIDTAVREELANFTAIAKAKQVHGPAPLIAAAPNGSSSLLPAVHCHCTRCESDIFFYQYRVQTHLAEANLCGQCAVESRRMHSVHSYVTRFPAPQGLAQLWTATQASEHWQLAD